MKPMLAGKVGFDQLDRLRYPLLASAKVDGVRAVVRSGRLVSRRGIALPNEFLQGRAAHWPEGLEGELLLHNLTRVGRRHVVSAVASHDGMPDVAFHCFDYAKPSYEFTRFEDRLHRIWEILLTMVPADDRVFRINHQQVNSPEDVRAFSAWAIGESYEGVVLRDPNGFYKRGRSSIQDQLMLKLKAFDDEEALVLSMDEERESVDFEGDNGRRQGRKDMKVGKGRLGSVRCRFDDGTEFDCGSGFDHADRELYWKQPDLIIGKRCTVKHEAGRLEGQKPLFPTWLGLRDDGL